MYRRTWTKFILIFRSTGFKSLSFVEFIHTGTATQFLTVTRGALLFRLLATQPFLYFQEDRGTLTFSNTLKGQDAILFVCKQTGEKLYGILL